jgi:hypothetical protein
VCVMTSFIWITGLWGSPPPRNCSWRTSIFRSSSSSLQCLFPVFVNVLPYNTPRKQEEQLFNALNVHLDSEPVCSNT